MEGETLKGPDHDRSDRLDVCHQVISILEIPVLITDFHMVCVQANASFHETFDLSDEDVAGVHLKLVDKGLFNIDELLLLLDDLRTGHDSFGGIEFRLDLRGQGERLFSMSGSRIVDPSFGRLLFLAMRDVTEETWALKSHRENEEKYRVLYQSSRDAIMMLAPPSWRFIEANPATIGMFRCRDEAEFVSLGPWDLSPPFQPDGQRSSVKAGQMILQAMENGSNFFQWVHRRLDGEEFPATVLLTRIELEGRTLLQATIRENRQFETGEDTNGAVAQGGREHVQLEELVRSRSAALRENEEKYRTVVEQSRDGIFIYSEGAFRFVNDSMCRLTGLSKDQLYSTSLLDVIHPEDRDRIREYSIRRTEGKDVPSIYPVRILDAAGRVLFVEASVRAITYHDRYAVLGTYRDITELKKKEDEQARLEKLESMGVLAGSIAHDFNNFLTVILGNMSLARRMVEPGSEVQELLISSEMASRNASELTEQLLGFANGRDPVKTEVRLESVLGGVVDLGLEGSCIAHEVLVPEDIWPVSADPEQIAQVLGSIIDNACRSLPENGAIKVKASNLTVDLQGEEPLAPGHFVRLDIENNGPHIPEKNISRIFDPFFTTRESGTGLGLATAHSIVTHHGGHIRAENLPDGGCRFSVYLPAEDNGRILEPPRREHMARSGERVLIMDDKAMVRSTATALLEHLGYQVDGASNGSEAVGLYLDSMHVGYPYHAVILDLTVPGGMGGREAIRELKRIDPSVKAVVSSGYSNDPVVSEYRHHGFSGAVVKPYSLAKLATVMKELSRN